MGTESPSFPPPRLSEEVAANFRAWYERNFVMKTNETTCLGLLQFTVAGVASAREVTVLREGWRFTREEHPAQMRYSPYDRGAVRLAGDLDA